jgi:protein-S-isoprenylcysteine O-methyltransferase Ste14
MYSGATLYMVGMPLLLGSWVGLLILPLILGALVARIFIEEAALRKGLPGYVDYANAVIFTSKSAKRLARAAMEKVSAKPQQSGR